MKSFYSQIPPEYEAHIINASDWLRLPDTIQLGTLGIKDGGNRQYYVLYAVKNRFEGVSFGAHYGSEPWEYHSHNADITHGHALNYCGGSTPSMIAAIRYYLLLEEQKKS